MPTDTPILPTETESLQPLLLRRPCGRDYNARADEPLQLFYGGWGVRCKDLADQWATALEIELAIDGEVILGELKLSSLDFQQEIITLLLFFSL
jgi:hypothetical protein